MEEINVGRSLAQIRAATIDFGASDAMQPTQLQKLGTGQFPLVIGGIAAVETPN